MEIRLPKPENVINIGSTEDVKCAYRFKKSTNLGYTVSPWSVSLNWGKNPIENFVVNIANASQTWTPNSFVESAVSDIRETVKNENVVLGLSGGVDSSSCFVTT